MTVIETSLTPELQSWRSEDRLLALEFTFNYDDQGLLRNITILPGRPAAEAKPGPRAEAAAGETAETGDDRPGASGTDEPLVFETIANGARVTVAGRGLKGEPVTGHLALQLGLSLPGREENGGVFFDLHYGEHGFHHLIGVFVTFRTSLAGARAAAP